MGLRSFVARREDVTLPDGTKMPVRGLGLSDVTALMAQYGPKLTLLFNRFVGDIRLQTLTPEAMGFVINEVLRDAPEIAYSIIAIAADEPDAIEQAKSIGIGAQAEAIDKIVTLTLVSEAEVKKLVEVVTRALMGTTHVVEGLGSLSQSGSGVSAEQ